MANISRSETVQRDSGPDNFLPSKPSGRSISKDCKRTAEIPMSDASVWIKNGFEKSGKANIGAVKFETFSEHPVSIRTNVSWTHTFCKERVSDLHILAHSFCSRSLSIKN